MDECLRRATTISPFIDGLLVRYDYRDRRWKCKNPRKPGTDTTHARAVYEHFFGEVPEGLHVHHKSGKASELEDDAPENLMCVSPSWNRTFLPSLARGFNIPERLVTDAYIESSKIHKGDDLFVDVCRNLIQMKDAGSI